MFSIGRTLCLESVWLTDDSNFLLRDESGLVSSITISSEICPAGTATTKYIQVHFKILNKSLKGNMEWTTQQSTHSVVLALWHRIFVPDCLVGLLLW